MVRNKAFDGVSSFSSLTKRQLEELEIEVLTGHIKGSTRYKGIIISSRNSSTGAIELSCNGKRCLYLEHKRRSTNWYCDLLCFDFTEIYEHLAI